MNSNLPLPKAPTRNPELDEDRELSDLAALGRVGILETDNLDETVLGAAAVGNSENLPSELIKGTENLTDWDEAADSLGRRIPGHADDGTVDVLRLVEAGIEEADRERRLAATNLREE